MASDNYWSRNNRISRRRLLGGGGVAGAGLAALATVGCGDDDNGTPKPAGSPTAPAGTPTPAVAQPKPGGVGLYVGTPGVFDTFDTNRTNFATNLSVFANTYDRIINWGTFIGGAKLAGGVAEKWEQPDLTQLTLKLRPNVFWHNKAPVNGRLATADDIAYHITRQRDAKLKDGTPDPTFQRKGAYSIVDSATVTDPTTVVVKLKRPGARFLNLLAQTYEFVQAREALDQFEAIYNKEFSEKLLIGTGPYTFVELKTDGAYKRKRFEKYWGQTYLDGSANLPLFGDLAARQAGFEQKQIDSWGAPTATVHDDAKNRLKGQVFETSSFTSTHIGGYYNAGGPPWNNPNLIGAIYRAFDRKKYIQQIHSGQGVPSAYVLAYQTPFNLPETELVKLGGFLPKFEDDLAEARKMWEAGGGPALGEIAIDMADLYISQYPDAPAVLQAMLKANLGNDVKVTKETYPNVLGSKLPKGQYGNGKAALFFIQYIPQPVDPEPTDDLLQFFKSDTARAKYYGVNQPGGITIPGFDDTLTKLDAELDQAKRVQIIQGIDKLLVQNYGAGVLHGFTAYTRALSWNYRKVIGGIEPSPLPVFAPLTREWIDTTDPSYQGRASDKGIIS